MLQCFLAFKFFKETIIHGFQTIYFVSSVRGSSSSLHLFTSSQSVSEKTKN